MCRYVCNTLRYIDTKGAFKISFKCILAFTGFRNSRLKFGCNLDRNNKLATSFFF